MICRSILKALAILLLIGAASAAAQERLEVTTFTPTNQEFLNPERGFWKFVEGSFAAATTAKLSAIRDAGWTMAYGVVRLDAFRSGPLPQTFLTRLPQA